ncbi:MAG: tetratricopeptide repeat protein [Candidatus Aminicenantes bacterium]|nr:tetratricopeptide repeat protein [Candidatus Aminicenantes bacterium]
MRKKRTLLFILTAVIVLIPFSAYPQAEGKARMKGVVKDTAGNPLPGVTVKLYSFRSHATIERKTDKKGMWKAFWVRSGKWNIDFDKTGFEPKKTSTFLKAKGTIVELETALKKMEGLVLKDTLMADFEKANRLFSAGKLDEALQTFRDILQKHPGSYIIYLSVGNCHFEKHEYEKAIAAYRKVLEKDPDNTKVLITIGNSYSNMKQSEKALEWYKKIEVSKIDDHIVLYNIGIFHFNSGDTKGAIDYLERSTDVQEDFLDGWYRLGLAYLGAGDNAAAIKSFETYLTYDKESGKAKEIEEILKAIKQ